MFNLTGKLFYTQVTSSMIDQDAMGKIIIMHVIGTDVGIDTNYLDSLL